MVEVPCHDPVQFPLSVLAPFNSGPTHVRRCVSIQPLFAEDRKEGGEERSSEARVQDGLDLYYCVGRAGPLWESGGVVSERGVIDLVDENAEEGSGLFTRVGLKLRLDVEDESRGDGGE